MFSIVFGIPLSLATLGTGVLLGLGTKWGVLRHRWVTAKLLVILVGHHRRRTVIGPATAAMRDGDGGARVNIDTRVRLRRARAHAGDRALGLQAAQAPSSTRKEGLMTDPVRDPVHKVRYAFEPQGDDLIVHCWLEPGGRLPRTCTRARSSAGPWSRAGCGSSSATTSG